MRRTMLSGCHFSVSTSWQAIQGIQPGAGPAICPCLSRAQHRPSNIMCQGKGKISVRKYRFGVPVDDVVCVVHLGVIYLRLTINKYPCLLSPSRSYFACGWLRGVVFVRGCGCVSEAVNGLADDQLQKKSLKLFIRRRSRPTHSLCFESPAFPAFPERQTSTSEHSTNYTQTEHNTVEPSFFTSTNFDNRLPADHKQSITNHNGSARSIPRPWRRRQHQPRQHQVR